MNDENNSFHAECRETLLLRSAIVSAAMAKENGAHRNILSILANLFRCSKIFIINRIWVTGSDSGDPLGIQILKFWSDFRRIFVRVIVDAPRYMPNALIRKAWSCFCQRRISPIYVYQQHYNWIGGLVSETRSHRRLKRHSPGIWGQVFFLLLITRSWDPDPVQTPKTAVPCPAWDKYG